MIYTAWGTEGRANTLVAGEERPHFVAEVLSEGDKIAVLETKLRYYQDHQHNRCVLFVRQDRVEAEQHDRDGAGWRVRQLSGAHEPLTSPDIGTVGCLGDLYKFTPLDPFAQTPPTQ